MKYLKQLDELISVLLLGGLTLVAFLQVLFRFVLNMPLDWTEEMVRYILVTFIYLSTVITVRKDKMIRIELIDVLLKGTPKRILDLVINLISAAFMGFLAYQTTFLIQNATAVHQTSPAMGIPLAAMYTIECLLFVLMAIMFVKVAVEKAAALRKGEEA